MALLVFSKESKPYFQVRLQPGATKIGRGEHCDVVLGEEAISREHALLYMDQSSILLKRLGKAKLRMGELEVDSHPIQMGESFHLGPWQATLREVEEKVSEDTLIEASHGPKTQAVALGGGGFISENLRLVLKQEGKEPRHIALAKQSLSMGADPKNDIVLEDAFVSSRHLKLSPEADGIWIYDLGSTNGTFLEGHKIREAKWELGSILKVGQSVLQLESGAEIKEIPPLKTHEFCGLWGGSPVMQKLYGTLKVLGPTEATVLILGESGAGKELVARGVHRLSSRESEPFVAINCGAISKELIESELFGHEKGAFTGAARRHEGAFGLAAGGTLFLDEIGELPLELQPKLLRVLESNTYRRVGGSEELNAHCRVVAATHRDLAKLVEEKKFREDLFFRLFVLPIAVPGLREHAEDIPLLCEKFLEEFSTGARLKTISETAMAKIKGHCYPGNVRELRNVMMRAVFLAQGDVLEEKDILFAADLQNIGQQEAAFSSGGIRKLEDMEKELILKALRAHDWNKTQASQSLGIAKSTLFSKLKLYNIQAP